MPEFLLFIHFFSWTGVDGKNSKLVDEYKNSRETKRKKLGDKKLKSLKDLLPNFLSFSLTFDVKHTKTRY